MAAKYIRLAHTLRELIFENAGNGIYKLPSEHAICGTYGVSRQTVREALRLLTKEGLIEKRKGSGSFSTGLAARQNNIAIMVSYEEEYIYPTLLSEIKSLLRNMGYSVMIYSTQNKIHTERRILEELLTAPIRGLIAEGVKTAFPNPNLDLYESLRSEGIPVLFLHSSYPALTGSICIKNDNVYGGYLLGKYLIQKNHSRIAGIFKYDDLQGPERYQGFLNAMRDFRLPCYDEQILWYGTPELDALESKSDTGFLTAFLHRQLKHCSAVICYNDEIAYWLIKELHYAGIQVPGDLSVVSFDNSYLSEMSPVTLTTLSHKKREISSTAASAITQMIQGIPVYTQELSWHIIIRASAP